MDKPTYMSNVKLKIAIIGANGKMGKLAQYALEPFSNEYTIIPITSKDNCQQILAATSPDIALELTTANSVEANTAMLIEYNIRPIIGASGLTTNQIADFTNLCKHKNLGGIVVPNFSLGMAVIHKTARELKKYYTQFSVVEFHHAQKIDKPSGTAKYTADLLGINIQDIASIRSDGFIAKQQLYATSPYERLIFDHESFDRKSFIAGILLCINKVQHLNTLIYGLEHIL